LEEFWASWEDSSRSWACSYMGDDWPPRRDWGGDSIAVFVLGFLGLEFVAIPTKGTATMGVV